MNFHAKIVFFKKDAGRQFSYRITDLFGYTKKEANIKFNGIIKVMKYGSRPHGGIAPGIERITMLLLKEKNIREVIAFSLNQNGKNYLFKIPNSAK